MEEKAKKILESLVPWKAKAFIARPGPSKNGYNWTEQELQKAAEKFVGKPIMTDHGDHCAALVGINTASQYQDGPKGPGIYVESIGLMEPELFQKIKGLPEKDIPPLLSGVSQGGTGEFQKPEGADEDTLPDVVNYEPREWSFTPFPAIPEASVLEFAEIMDSLNKTVNLDELEDDPEFTPEELAKINTDEPDEMILSTEELAELEAHPDFVKLVDTPDPEEAKWIQKAIKRPGALHKALGIPKGKPIPLGILRKAAKKKGRIGRMARLALTLRKMRKGRGKDSTPPAEIKDALKQGTDQATIEANIKKLEEAQKQEPPAKTEEKPLEAPPAKPDETLELVKTLHEEIKELKKTLEELKTPKEASKGRGIAVADTAPQKPQFESINDIIARVKELRELKDKDGQPLYSTKNAWRLATAEFLEQVNSQ